MLVLSRHKDESIIIDGHIEVMVVSIQGGKVRLGITADRQIPVHRKEVQEAIDRDGERRNSPPPFGESQPGDESGGV